MLRVFNGKFFTLFNIDERVLHSILFDPSSILATLIFKIYKETKNLLKFKKFLKTLKFIY